jgi:hypothetical protein
MPAAAALEHDPVEARDTHSALGTRGPAMDPPRYRVLPL